MTEHEAYGQAFEHGRKVGYEEGKRDAVKHGRWINTEYDEWECSECHNNLVCGYDEDPANYGLNYCSSCGARMDEGGGA